MVNLLINGKKYKVSVLLEEARMSLAKMADAMPLLRHRSRELSDVIVQTKRDHAPESSSLRARSPSAAAGFRQASAGERLSTTSNAGLREPLTHRPSRVQRTHRGAMRLIISVFLAAIASACSTTSQKADTSQSQSAVLYEGARLIAGDGGPAIENSAFLVERGVITRVGRKGEITLPAQTVRVALEGKTVMPTLIDAHSHPGFQKGMSFAAWNFSQATVTRDLKRALYFGVSTVMSQGIEKGDVTYQVRDAQRTGRVDGARLLIAGRGIGAPNAGPGSPAFAGIVYEVTTEDEIRRAVRELAVSKVDAVKIWVDDRNGRAPRLSPALFRAAIDEGHKQGLKVGAHEFYHVDAVDLVDAGVDAFLHLVRDQEMSDALVSAIVKRGVYVMPNLVAAEYVHKGRATDPYMVSMLRATVPPLELQRMEALAPNPDDPAVRQSLSNYALQSRSMVKLNAAGARIILGADTGLPDSFFGYAEQRELELLAGTGMTPAQVIVAATSRTAAYLGLIDTGSLTVGKDADFLVLDANPLDDIRNTRRISKVFIKGAEVDRAALSAELLRETAE
jgi:imidazolonepropionase-like amidohydrolase